MIKRALGSQFDKWADQQIVLNAIEGGSEIAVCVLQ